MKNSVLKLISILLFASAISLPGMTSSYAKSTKNVVASEVTNEMNCCDKMDMMQKEMKSMMDQHKKMKNEMSSLFNELKQTGKLTPEKITQMQNIEQVMKQMEEKMKQMSTERMDDLK
ncbi:hypothetical protein [Cytobacillus firmus]|uniref:Uncharacterized protein n=1 Tax=Cytobacillus firmus TaxID=1399 RepID=A0AA46SL82_CYTFI|nr:hypothetical protein [Cytobacillus firmus]UYG98077.1 hypothetical protein OD459_26710 [Cytobacillus firmus]